MLFMYCGCVVLFMYCELCGAVCVVLFMYCELCGVVYMLWLCSAFYVLSVV